VVGVEVIAEVGVVDQLSGEQPLDAGAAALGGAAGPALHLARVLLADGGEQAVAERGLGGQQGAKLPVRDFGPLRLFGEEVGEEGVAGEVAP
jgi:hypothetical protein